MKIIRFPDKKEWTEVLQRPVFDSRAVDGLVVPILEAVKKEGDKALIDYTRKLDGVDAAEIAVGEEEITTAEKEVNARLRDAIDIAARNIEKFHRSQQLQVNKVEISPGITCWQKSVPIEKVGLYIPGGTAPLFSTVLMLALPARIAGCREIIMCTPPARDGKIHPAILYAAKVTGVTRIFRAGGAQAIAAMAYGTETVPRVYKIFGPGNQYVMAAKQLVSRDQVAIDMPAGPSELAVMADETADPSFVAADLLSQAEHGSDSQVLLFTTSEKMIRQVEAEVLKQLAVLPRKDFATRSLENSRLILLKNADDMVSMVNAYAPEHLILSVSDAERIAERILNAGSVFLGKYTPESAGDYLSGTNHTLPTNGYARMYNGVNLDSFVKKITFQHITAEALAAVGPAIMQMAETEELVAHSNAVGIRTKDPGA